MKKIMYLLLFIFISCCIYYIKFYKRDLYSGYTYNISPQVDFLNGVLKTEYGDEYKLYTAYFNQDDAVPDIGGYNPNAILWLGRGKLNYQRGDIKNIKDYGIVLCSNFNHLLAVKMLGAKRFYQFPEFMVNNLELKKNPQYYALVGSPLHVQEILKKQNLPYKKYTYANIEALRQSLSEVKAIFIEQGENTAYNMDTVFIEAIANNIVVSENKIKDATSPQSLLGDIIEYYYDFEEVANIIEGIEDGRFSQKIVENKNWVMEHFCADVAKEKLLSIVKYNDLKAINNTSLYNFHVWIRNGFHPSGDVWLAKDVINKLDKKNKWHLTFNDTPYRPQSPVQIIMIGNMSGVNDDIISENAILWQAFPYKIKSFEQNIIDLAALSKSFKTIAVSSQKVQQNLKDKGIKAIWIPQFTNTDKFYPDYDEDKKSEILFVGNNHYERKIVNLAKSNNFPITIYGNYWPKNWAKAKYIDNRILRKYYSSAKIVLNSQLEAMKNFGVIANRIFDVTACKGFVISEYVDEIKDVYGDCIPMYKTEEEFVKLVNYYLTHEEERKQKAQCAYEITLKNFTAESVAKKFDAIIEEISQNN